MPIVFIHGVATRDTGEEYQDWIRGIARLLRQYIAPVISRSPANVTILAAYWGKLGVHFAWNMASRPRSPLLRMGAGGPPPIDQAMAVASDPAAVKDAPGGTGGAPAGRGLLPDEAAPAAPTGSSFRFKDLEPDQLSDLLVTALQDGADTPSHRALASIAADQVAQDLDRGPNLRARLATLPNREAELAFLRDEVGRRAAELVLAEGGVVGQGVPAWLREFQSRLDEATRRVGSTPGYVLTRTLAEFRGPANAQVTLFAGDVFQYLARRGTPEAPGAIPKLVLDTMKKARSTITRDKEPMIVVSHSMGGQIVYDLVKSFLPRDPQGHDLRIDFWCATASQVGLFEEMKQFLASDPRYGADQPGKLAPYPDRHYLGHWWNVWDPNDFLSYTAQGIFAEVDDESYDSGMSILHAHGGYLERPSFYRRLAEKIAAAARAGWR